MYTIALMFLTMWIAVASISFILISMIMRLRQIERHQQPIVYVI